jgi:hypothetical protein
MSAILVSPEYWWLEAGSSNDLVISDNAISHCSGIPIRIEAKGGNGQTAPAGAHRNLIISGNAITGCAMPGILVTSTAGLQIRDNRMEHWVDSDPPPGPRGTSGPQERKPVERINCEETPFPGKP